MNNTHIQLVDAIHNGEYANVHWLLSHGANVNAIDHASHETPLGLACLKQHTSIFKLLLKFGADINQIGQSMTPLYTAVLVNSATLVKLSIVAGAVIDCHDNFNSTPLLSAYYCANRNWALIAMLVVAGANVPTTLSLDDDTMTNACNKLKRARAKLLLPKPHKTAVQLMMIGYPEVGAESPLHILHMSYIVTIIMDEILVGEPKSWQIQ